jgi:hypothetical protein
VLISTLLVLLGFALVALTLRDVFSTVVVPGESKATLHIARRLMFLLLPVRRRGKRGVPVSFAPFVLVTTFLIWMLLLTFGFAIMALGLKDSFSPPLPSFGQAVYVVGSAVVTTGQSETEALGLARWVTVGAGFCGLAVLTMAVTYLLGVQNSIERRDTGIFKMRTSAGHPPSALALLEKFAVLGARDELCEVLHNGRDWCATVRQSHSSHPSLIYFRSIGTGSGWPAALGALLDLALILEKLVDDPRLVGPAVLLREEALQMAEALGQLIGLEPNRDLPADEAIERLTERLERAGYSVRGAPHDRQGFAEARAPAVQYVGAMADHLGMPRAPLLPD